VNSQKEKGVQGNAYSSLNWTGCALIITAALLIALNSDYSKWAFIAYPVGNSLLLLYFLKHKNTPQVLVNLVMLAIAGLGLVCWFTDYCF
jgi:membrane-bound ClpP family serine protease